MSPDDTLAESISEELELRSGIRNAGIYDAALISEWDTSYGQALPEAMAAAFKKHPPCKGRPGNDGCPGIHPLTYLRGLDGQRPANEGMGDEKPDKIALPANNDNNATVFFKTQPDKYNLDRPVGQGQFDYLRRMSEHLLQIDENLRRQDPPEKACSYRCNEVAMYSISY